jgi:type IV pilus assembly protein PilM
MPLFSRKKTSVGLDIGSGLIKVAVVDHGNAAPELVKVAITKLPSDAIVEGEVMDPGIVADAIRACLDSAGSHSRHVITAVGGRDVIIKKIQTERVKDKQARELMRWEAEQHVPDVESVELDFQILDGDKTSDQMSVLLVAAKRDLIDSKLRVLAEAGVTPTVVDVDAFALHNAFEVNYPEAMLGLVALVNVGHEVTNVNIMDGGVPLITRELPLGTRRFSEDLQRQHGITAKDADQMIRGFDRSANLDSVLQVRSEEIAVGIERGAAFLSTSKTVAQVRAVYLCGGGSRTPGLVEMLGTRLGVPVQHANPLARLSIRDGALDNLSTDEVAPLLMLPIGLALRQ